MDSARWQKIQTLFHQAADVPKADQRVYLESQCPEDPALISEIMILLEFGSRFWNLGAGQQNSILQEGRITMDLTCPKCKSEDTQKLTMVTSATGLFGKILRFGVVYVYNLWIPLASVFFGIAFGIVFAMFNGYLGFFAFVGTLAAGYFARKWVKAKSRSKFADLSDNMKQNGFQCKRCEHLFIPVDHLPAGRAQVASA